MDLYYFIVTDMFIYFVDVIDEFAKSKRRNEKYFQIVLVHIGKICKS